MLVTDSFSVAMPGSVRLGQERDKWRRSGGAWVEDKGNREDIKRDWGERKDKRERSPRTGPSGGGGYSKSKKSRGGLGHGKTSQNSVETKQVERRARGRRSWSREESRSRYRKTEPRRSREGVRRRSRQRSRSIRDKRSLRNGRVEKEVRQTRTEVAQLRKEVASVAHNVNVLKAISESTTRTPRTQQAQQDQEEHYATTQGILGPEMKTDLARRFQDEADLTLKEIIKKGKQQIDKRFKFTQFAGRVT